MSDVPRLQVSRPAWLLWGVLVYWAAEAALGPLVVDGLHADAVHVSPAWVYVSLLIHPVAVVATTVVGYSASRWWSLPFERRQWSSVLVLPLIVSSMMVVAGVAAVLAGFALGGALAVMDTAHRAAGAVGLLGLVGSIGVAAVFVVPALIVGAGLWLGEHAAIRFTGSVARSWRRRLP